MTSRWWGVSRNGYKSGFPTPGGTLPTCSVAPSISPTGTVGVGTQLTMDHGTWANATSFTYTFTEGGVVVQTGPLATYTSPNNNVAVSGSVTANGIVTQAASNTVLVQSADTTPPTLTAPTAAAIDYATASIGVTTDEGNGTLYAVITTSATPPTQAQVIAGQDNLGAAVPTGRAASQGITSPGAKTFGMSGLTGSTTFYTYFCHRDAAGNPSAVKAAASFTTPAAPVLSAPTLTIYNGSIYTSSAPNVSDPPSIHMDYDLTIGEGDYVEEQIDSDANFGGAATFTATIDNGSGAIGTILTVTALASGSIPTGKTIVGGTVFGNTTIVSQLGGTPNGVGTYQVDIPQLVASTTMRVALKDEELILWNNNGTLDTANSGTGTPQTFDIETGNTPATTFNVRRRIRRFYGDTSIWSAWSNTVTFSIASLGISTTWNASDTSNWNAAITLTNSNRTFSDSKNGGTGASRSSASFQNTDKIFFILDRTFANAGIVRAGIASSNYGNATTHFILTAADAATGYAETAWVQGPANIYIGGSFVVTLAGTHAQSDSVYVALDVGAKKVWFGVKSAGVVTWDGVPGVSGGRSIAGFTSFVIKMLANIQNNSVGDSGTITIETLAAAAADPALPAGFTPAGTP